LTKCAIWLIIKLMPIKQSGFAHILVLLAAIGLIAFLIISNSASFKEKLFSSLYPKPSSHASEAMPQVESVPDEILLKFKTGVEEKVKNNIRKQFGVKKQDEIASIGVEKGQVPEKAKAKIIEALSHNPMVEYVEENYLRKAQLTPNDAYFVNQWNLSKISMPAAWDYTTGSDTVTIAVLDTGININHEDLVGKSTGNLDDNGHGTLVAGITGAVGNNSKGIAGICWGCKVASYKVLNSNGIGGDSGIATAITQAADQGAKVINLSLGSYSFSSTEQSAINYAWNKGVLIVGASGNDGLTTPFYPAAFTNVLSVGQTDPNDSRMATSNYGSWLDVVAPGLSSLSTTMDGSYSFASGTSIAAPHVSGLAGLIYSANPGLSNQQVVDIIQNSAIDLGTVGRDDQFGYGRIAIDRALQMAKGITPNPDNRLPTISITSPSSGSTIGGIITVNTDATDNVGVTKVEFYFDNGGLGAPFATDTTAPFSAVFDTTKVSSGNYYFRVKAFDAAGNQSGLVMIPVTVSQTTSKDTTVPTVLITSPTAGQTVSKIVPFQATAADNVSVSVVSFFVDGVFVGQSSSSPYTVSWDSNSVPNGTHTVFSSALDSSNNLGESSAVTITVNNSITATPTPTIAPTSSPTSTPSTDNTSPSVSITSPANNATVPVRGTVNILASAADLSGISKVEFYINGTLTCTDTTSAYSCSWKVPGAKNKSYTLTGKAYDIVGNSSSSSITVTAK
jgi:thermitase